MEPGSQSNSAQPEHPPGKLPSVWTTWADPTSEPQSQLKPKYKGQGSSGRPLNPETSLQRHKDNMGGLFLKKEGRSIPNTPLAGDRQSHHLQTQCPQLQRNTLLTAHMASTTVEATLLATATTLSTTASTTAEEYTAHSPL